MGEKAEAFPAPSKAIDEIGFSPMQPIVSRF